MGIGGPAPRLDAVALAASLPQAGRLTPLPGRLGTLGVSATLFGGSEALTVKAHAEGGGLALDADGTVASPWTGSRTSTRRSAGTATSTQVLRLLAPGWSPPAAVGALSLAARVAVSPMPSTSPASTSVSARLR